MPSSNVHLPRPLTRLEPFYPPAPWGAVYGGLNEKGLRQSSTGSVFWVDPNYVGVSDLRAGTDPEYPLATIGVALTKCTDYAGDVIVVMANDAWQYGQGVVRALPIQESVTVTTHGVKIVGMSPSGTLGVPWIPAANLGTCITVHAMDCLIEGFVFTADWGVYTGADGISVEWDGGPLYGENLTVRNCHFDGSIDTAIQLEYSWYCDIHDNTFQECDEYGIYVDAAGSGAAYLRIHDNIFRDCGTSAMWLRQVDDSEVWGNSIYNRTALGAGLATDEGITTANGTNNMVFDNYFSCLLPVPANGDLDDLCTSVASDAWVGNHCIDGLVVARPT